MKEQKKQRKSPKQRKRTLISLGLVGIFLIAGTLIYNKIVVWVLERGTRKAMPQISAEESSLMAGELEKILWFGGFIVTALILVVVFLLLWISEQRERTLQSTALDDKLTGLLNWNGMQEAVKELPDNGMECAFVLFHINYFKRMNTAFGFEAGGRLLRDVAAMLQEIISEGELACRISEDNYALLLKHQSDEAFSEKINQIFTSLEQVRIKEKNITYNYPCTYTAGVCLMKEMNEGETISDIRDKARIVMESYPNLRSTRWKFFDDDSRKELLLKRELEKGLVKAIGNREFVPYFQPQFRLESNELAGAEVLARWNHPELGLITPKHFISLLERAGGILELDMNMLEAACKRLRGWMDHGLLPVPMMVNMSSLNIHRNDLLDRADSLIKKYQIPARLIALELPETVANDDGDKVAVIAGKLKEMGFLLIIDVAGSGKIILDTIRKIPFDYIKVEKEFLLEGQDDTRNQVVRGHLLQMAKELNISLMVKNVETKEQADGLTKYGLVLAQGEYFAPAMEEQEFEQIAFPNV